MSQSTESSAPPATSPPPPSSSPLPISVLIVGTGRAASFIFKALASPPYRPHFSLLALVRSTSDDIKLARQAALHQAYGVRLIPGDLSQDASSLSELLHSYAVHTVISTTSFLSPVDQQLSLLHACVSSASVRRFIPSDFGPDWTAFPRPNPIDVTSDAKVAVQRAVEASGLDWLTFTCGFFYSHVLGRFTGVDLTAHTITAPASFHTKLTATDTDDIGRVVAEALMRDEHRQRILITGQTFTWADLADLLDEETGHPFTRIERPLGDIDEEITVKGADAALMSKFQWLQARQQGTWWEEEGTYNRLHGLQMKTLRAYVREQLQKLREQQSAIVQPT